MIFDIDDDVLIDKIKKCIEKYNKTTNDYYYKNRNKLLMYQLKRYYKNKTDKIECNVCNKFVFDLPNHEKSKYHIERTKYDYIYYNIFKKYLKVIIYTFK